MTTQTDTAAVGEQPTSSGDGDTGAAGRVRESAAAARARASDAYSAARERTSAVYGTAREKAARATRTTAEGIDSNPVAAVVGGLALGAVLAALLPRTRREEELLGGVGRRITDAASEAGRAAREAATGKLDELGLNRETARQKLNEIASSAGEAVRTSADAAAQTLKASRQP